VEHFKKGIQKIIDAKTMASKNNESLPNDKNKVNSDSLLPLPTPKKKKNALDGKNTKKNKEEEENGRPLTPSEQVPPASADDDDVPRSPLPTSSENNMHQHSQVPNEQINESPVENGATKGNAASTSSSSSSPSSSSSSTSASATPSKTQTKKTETICVVTDEDVVVDASNVQYEVNPNSGPLGIVLSYVL